MRRRFLQRVVRPERTVRIVATLVEAEHLKPGDLFSDRGPDYWNMSKLAFGQVFVKFNDDADADVGFEPVYRITIVREDISKVENRNAHLIEAEFSPFTPPGIDYASWRNKVKWRRE